MSYLKYSRVMQTGSSNGRSSFSFSLSFEAAKSLADSSEAVQRREQNLSISLLPLARLINPYRLLDNTRPNVMTTKLFSFGMSRVPVKQPNDYLELFGSSEVSSKI